MRDRFVRGLNQLAEDDPNLFLVTGDLGFGVLEGFAKNHPSQFLNAGVAEQNMLGVSAGLASLGYKVFVYSIGNFPTLRCLEQIRNDVAYHGLDVNIIAVGGGFSYGSLGMSHHATEDLSIMRSIPGITTLVPGTINEVDMALRMAIETLGPTYIRLDKSGAESLPQWLDESKSDWKRYSTGKNVLLVAAGGVLSEAWDCARILGQNGIKASVFSAIRLGIPDDSEFRDELLSFDVLVSLEENRRTGGLGGLLAEHLSQFDHHPPLMRFGLIDEYTSVSGSQAYLRNLSGLSSELLAASILERMAKQT